MKRKLCVIGVITLLTIMLCGCSKQDGEVGNNDSTQNSQINQETETTENDTQETESEITEEILAEAMDLSSYAEIPENAIQEFWSWSQDSMGITYPDKENVPASYWGVESELVEEYATFLAEEMGLILQESSGTRYGYTHPTIEAKGVNKNKYLSKEYPIVWEYGGSQNAVLTINEEVFTVYDMGYRRNGERQEVKVYGDSAGAALIKTSDGIYKTDDGRLQTKINEAMVIRDGVSSVAEAYHEIVDTEERLFVEFYYRDEGFYLEVPKYYSLTGDIYRIDELVKQSYPTTRRDKITDVDFDGKPTFLMSYNGEWIGPNTHWNKYEQLTVRVMYYEKNVEAVYYVYAKFAEGDPTEVEALVAVDLSPKQEPELPSAEVDTSEVIELKDGDTLLLGQTGEISYGSRKSGSAYHVYNWSIVEGKDLVILDEGHDSCKITARGKGTVVVKCSYSYTKKKENVLTGREEDDPEIDTKRFKITIE